MLRDEAIKFVEENMKTIFAYALSRVSHKEDAEDLAGDIILAILESSSKIRDPDAFFGYVWAIAANTYKKFQRRRARTSGTVSADEDFDIADDTDIAGDVIRSEETRILYRELSLLSREYRLCTIAYYFDGLSCAEIADKYGITPEMVKYYLYKTRKILKEGISMEREFGQKSFKPAEFHFTTLVFGAHNEHYQTLFSRRLPGNIILSAYYTPMTVRELSVELGVASAYLEDEIKVLENYGMIERLPSGKYQTRLLIYTESYMDELHRHADSTYGDALSAITALIRGKLPEVRALGFRGSALSDNRLLWAFLWHIINDASCDYVQTHFPDYASLYDSTTGISYGLDHLYDENDPHTIISMAGRSNRGDGLRTSYIDIGAVPRKNCVCHLDGTWAFSEIRDAVKGDSDTPFVTISEEMLGRVDEILADANAAAGKLYGSFIADAIDIMRHHAPKGIHDEIERTVTQSITSDAIATLLAVAVRAGALTLPDEDDTYPLAFFAIAE